MFSFPIPELCVSEDTVYRSSASKNDYKVRSRYYVILQTHHTVDVLLCVVLLTQVTSHL